MPIPRPIALLVALVAVAVLAAGCGGDDDGSAPGTTAGADGATTSSTEAAPDAGGSVVALEEGGLSIQGERLVFGEATEDEAVPALEGALGESVGEEDLEECGEGPLRAVSFPSLVAYFQDGVLTGWRVLDAGPVILTTEDGIGLGSTRAEVEAAFPDAVVEETSLGVELTTAAEAPQLSALLTDDTPDAQVDEIWSGTSCIAR